MNFDPAIDFYEELEVSPSATPGTIEAAWRSLLKRHHPDIVGPEQGAAKAKRLNVAHDVLGDPAERKRYDEWRAERQRARESPPPAAAPPRPPRTPRQKAQPRTSPPSDDPPERPAKPPKPIRLASAPGGRPYRGGPDWTSAASVVLIGLAVIGGLRLAIDILASSSVGAAVSTPAENLGSAPSPSHWPSAATYGPSAAASLATTPEPSSALQAPSDAVAQIERAGTGDGGPWSLGPAVGRYTLDYRAVTTPGYNCAWQLWLATGGLEDEVASIYPVDGPARDRVVVSIDTASSARVTSTCPSWSFTLSRVGP